MGDADDGAEKRLGNAVRHVDAFEVAPCGHDVALMNDDPRRSSARFGGAPELEVGFAGAEGGGQIGGRITGRGIFTIERVRDGGLQGSGVETEF